MIERFNRTLENQLAIFVYRNQGDWDRWIPFVLMAYRSSVHESTRQTPACLMFGRELNLPLDLLYGRPPEPERPAKMDNYVQELEEKLEDIHKFTRARVKMASDRMKQRYDVGTARKIFESGDLVWLYNPQRKKGISPKLASDWEGPYEVVKRINELLYRVKRSSRGKSRLVHRNRLWRYAGNAT